jgi:hypothetical protein
MKGEIVETMLVLQVRFMREARGAQIDAGDARFPVIEGIARGGVAAATRDQDIEVLPVRPIGPERVPVAFEIAPVPPRPHVRSIEVRDGTWIHPFLVLTGDGAKLGCRFDQRHLPLRQRRSAPMTAVYLADREFVQPAPSRSRAENSAPQARRQHDHHRREGARAGAAPCTVIAMTKLAGRSCHQGMPV